VKEFRWCVQPFWHKAHMWQTDGIGVAYTRQFRLSVTCVLCVKTAERIIEILSLSVRPIILVFRHQGSLLKSDSFTPNGGAKYKWAGLSCLCMPAIQIYEEERMYKDIKRDICVYVSVCDFLECSDMLLVVCSQSQSRVKMRVVIRVWLKGIPPWTQKSQLYLSSVSMVVT